MKPGNRTSLFQRELSISASHGNTTLRRCCTSFVNLDTPESFGVGSVGKLLAVLIMGYSAGQWVAPWMARRIFDTYHNYDLTWKVIAAAGVFGAAMIYAISVPREVTVTITGNQREPRAASS